MNPHKLFLEACHSRQKDEKWAKSFCHCENGYFLKCLFLSTSEVLKNSSYHFHRLCQNTFWTLTKCFRRLLKLDNIRKIVQLTFFTEMIAFFSKNLCFQQLLRCCGNDPITSKLIVRVRFGPSKNVF